MNLDFFLAKQKHYMWKIQLKAFLLDLQDMSAGQAVDHTQCDLGKWLYGFGLERYGDIKEMAELEKVHQQLHRLVRDVLDAKNNGDRAKAMELYAGLDEISGRIEKSLDAIEKKIVARAEG